MKIAIRLDDITPDMNWVNFNRMKNILMEEGICPLIGVVPDNQDQMLHFEDNAPDFYEQVKELQQQGWLIAQHGFRHVYTTNSKGILGLNAFSEFAGESFQVQKERILAGKKILSEHGIKTDIFMAPGHTYDKKTMQILRENGFIYVTDGFYKEPYRQDGLIFIPQRAGELSRASGIDTVCVHTNLMEKDDFTAFSAYLKMHRQNFVNYAMLMQEHAVRKGIRVSVTERLTIEKRILLRKIGSSNQAQKYFTLCQAKHNIWGKIKKVLFFPYLCYLISMDRNTGTEENHE